MQHLCLYIIDQQICNSFLQIPTPFFGNSLLQLLKQQKVVRREVLISPSIHSYLQNQGRSYYILHLCCWILWYGEVLGPAQTLAVSLSLLSIIQKILESLQNSMEAQQKLFFRDCGICWIQWYPLEIWRLRRRMSWFFHLSRCHQAGCRASPWLFQMKPWPNLSLDFILYSPHMPNMVVLVLVWFFRIMES